MPGPFLLSRIGYTKSQKKMRTKTLNTEVLNNTTPPQQQQAQIIIEQEPTVAPPLPPRSPHEQHSVQGTGEVNLPGAPSLHTHSSKFPIEREVIVRSEEKQCKIPNLADYMRRAKPSVAPDAPQKQLAWTHQIKHSTSQQQHDTPGTSAASGVTQDIVNHQVYKAVPVLESTSISEPSPIRPVDSNAISLDAGPATSTPEENVRGLPSRTYKSLKDIVTRGFSNKGPDTSLSPQSQLRQAGIYLQPQPVQYRLSQQQQHQQQQQQHQPQQHQQHQVNDSYRVYPVNSNYTETPRRDLSKAQSHDSLLGQDNRYRQDGVSQGIYMQQQNQRIVYSGAGPSRVPYFYNSQQTSETQFSHQETPRNRQYGTRHYEYSPEQLASQRRHFAEQQRHNGPFLENRQLNDHCDDNQRRIGEDKQGEVRNQVNQQLCENPTKSLEQSNNHHDEESKPKIDQPKLCSQDDDDEGGFVKRGAQSDSGRGSTVYSNAKPSVTSAAGDKGGEEWTERVETELRQILSGSGASSDSISSVSPPLPPLSPPASSGDDRPKYVLRSNALGLGGGFKNQNGPLWVSRTGEKSARTHHKQSKSTSNLLSSRIEIDSMLDENNSSDEEDYADTRLIRKQLEGLESMYGQVLKLLKARRQHGGTYDGLDLRHSRRRTCGSISSVPSSVSSRPIRNNRSQTRGKVRDFKGINKRFQRLESHVVTLARSVAHLSSEMRTQHLMMQEMEVMRGELAALRIQTNVQHQQQQQQQQPGLVNAARGEGQGNSTTPAKVKRLTKFFGDEPPLLRLFLRGLGYEKYASLFEKERIGLLELPYLTEDRLHKLGIPLGPRLRILQQAHLANPNTLAVL
ncbi:1-phosphatidylinositol 3-phosphate 5-kinase isoform X3 [Halyomorpha halys]|uniref:1-phosphatidylinositol 3-phosphate 5-kinase isoform X3 n=1 Tax=Halyomorpha halys TaxID=286706 RepID=UPI0034D269B5